MGNKVFISYKYGDTGVQSLNLRDKYGFYRETKVRDYVDVIQDILNRHGIHINKAELDGESLQEFSDDYIRSTLAEKIFDSSVTVVLISPNMREFLKEEKAQWIPWEISYSLRLKRRRFNGDNGQRSNRNGIILVYLPDRIGSYEYYKFFNHFSIVNNNLKNIKTVYQNTSFDNGTKSLPESYFLSCTWSQFCSQINYWIDFASKLRMHCDKYNICVKV